MDAAPLNQTMNMKTPKAKTMKTNPPTSPPVTDPTPLRPVIVCTEYRGVFYGLADDTSGDRIFLKNSRMAISWGTTRGVLQLAETGPTSASKISARAPLVDLRKVTAVVELTPAAAAAWAALP